MTEHRHDDEPRDLVQSVSRALRVLEEVARFTEPVTVKAIARRAQLNLSTTYHLIRTLAYEGYVVRHQDGRYVVGPEVARRFRDMQATLDRPPRAHAVLAQLATVTDRSAYLGRFVRGRILITDLVEGRQSPYLEDIEVGLEAAAHATAVGKALLSTLPRPQRRNYLTEQGLRPFTRRTATDLDRLDHEIAAFTQNRPILECGQFRDSVACAAALVSRRDADDPWWALVISSRGETMGRGITAELMRAAGDLSEPAEQHALAT
ncbi:IclR family transcriptional regulator C-terminal domain-containing protein [soil metagenome]